MVAELQLDGATEDDVAMTQHNIRVVAQCDRARLWLAGEAAALECWLPAVTAWRWWLLDPTWCGGEEEGRRRCGGGCGREQGKRSDNCGLSSAQLGFPSKRTVDGLSVHCCSHAVVIRRQRRSWGWWH